MTVPAWIYHGRLVFFSALVGGLISLLALAQPHPPRGWRPAPIVDANATIRAARRLPACPFACIRLAAHAGYTRLVLCLPPTTARPVSHWNHNHTRFLGRVRLPARCTPAALLQTLSALKRRAGRGALLAPGLHYAWLPHHVMQLMWQPLSIAGPVSVRTGYLKADKTHRSARWIWDFVPRSAHHTAPVHTRASPGKTASAAIKHRIPAPPRPLPTQPVKVRLHPQHLRPVIVVIDPGHGGKDPGAVGVHGLKEKHVALAIAKQLYAMLHASSFFQPYLTRKTDYFLPLRARIARAHAHRADVFISIHADAYFHHNAAGASVYALSEKGATSEAAKWLAHKANQEQGGGRLWQISNPMLKPVILNLQQKASIQGSLQLGEAVLGHLAIVIPLHHTHTEQANFVVLKSPDMTSILVETGFLSNEKDANRLTQARYRRRLARAIMAGMVAYYRQYPLQGSRFSATTYKKFPRRKTYHAH